MPLKGHFSFKSFTEENQMQQGEALCVPAMRDSRIQGFKAI